MGYGTGIIEIDAETLREIITERDDLKARIAELGASYRGALYDAEYFEKRVTELEEDRIGWVDASYRWEADYTRLKEERDQLRARVEELEEMSATHTKFWEYKLKKVFEEREQLREQIEGHKKGYDSVCTAYTAERLENKQLQARVAELEATHPSVVDTAKIIALREERDQLRITLNQRERELFGANAELQKENDQLRAELELERDNHQEKLNDAFNEGMYTAKKELCELRAELETEKANHKTTALLSEMKYREIVSLEAELKLSQTDRDEMVDEVARLEAELEALKPKPVVSTSTIDFWGALGKQTITVRSENGVAVSAEVIKSKEGI